MSHNIHFNEKKGTHSFVSNHEKAWHGLGQIVEGAMTAAEVIEKANLDYDVKITTVHGQVESEGGLIYPKYPDIKCTYRTDTNDVLGLVGGRYEVVQNKEAFGFFDAIIAEGEAIFETAGALGKGEKIFVTAKLPEDILVHGEPCEKYIMLMNSHDGSSSIIAGFTTIRVVCQNTLRAALRDLTNRVCINHTKGAKDRLNEAYRVMGLASKYMDEVSTIFNQMASTKISDDALKAYITEVMKPTNLEGISDEELQEKMSTRFKNQVEETYAYALGHPTQTTDAARGTLWGAYNAISGYYNHVANFKSQEHKFTSQFLGNANNRILKAFDKAVALM